jgi:hypothetical protein
VSWKTKVEAYDSQVDYRLEDEVYNRATYNGRLCGWKSLQNELQLLYVLNTNDMVGGVESNTRVSIKKNKAEWHKTLSTYIVLVVS